ncbi:hypothetical protein CCMSSC00406_0003996 [Pleurotus cornucopiae]|uniref:Uncharacterized protein n=1 Tax=Pleurotus cornucopiae TaxID=5321 RepID=A0ACB7IRG3_PLECO|nr:hypothetical protein CCMSSC00406_0003996 [Pleurotus cornucopiae]
MSKAPFEAESLNTESNLDLDYETDSDIASPGADEGPQGSMVTSEEYYFEDGDLFILVDDALFRVHEHFLSSSASHSFRTTVGNGNEGWNESKPIILHNISKQDFQDVLWVFYDETLRRKAPAEKWLGILLTAEKLMIQRIQTLAIGKLAKMEPPNVDPITRNAVQQRYNIDMAWAKDAFMDVVQRTEPLTEEEAIDIGTFATVTIAYLRTPHGKQMKKRRSPWPWSPEPLAMVRKEQEPEPAFYILPRNLHGCSVTQGTHSAFTRTF